jgi:hypothetical protein
MAEKYKFQKAKPSGVEAAASKCPDPSVHGGGGPQNAGLTGAKMMKQSPVSPKAQKRYASKGVGKL